MKAVVRLVNLIVVLVLHLMVGMVVVVVLVQLCWWWRGCLGITGDGGLMVVVVMGMVMGVLKWTPKGQYILVFIWLVVKISFRRHHTLTVGDVTFNHKIDCVRKL